MEQPKEESQSQQPPASSEQVPEAQAEPQVDIYEEIKTLKEEEKNICPEKISEFITSLYTKGLIYKLKDKGVNHLPVALYPSPIPKGLFDKIYFYQIALNKILYKLSNDQSYLETVLSPLASKDNFVQKLLEISKKSLNFDKKQKIRLGIFRNDYLLDKEQKFLFLQDYKTSTVGFGSYTNILLDFHKYFDEKYPNFFAKYKSKDKENTKEIPQNKLNTIEKFSESILEAIKLAFPQVYKDTIIVFVVNKNAQNKLDFDLENLVKKLFDEHKIKSAKLTLSEISKKITKDEEGNLILDGNKVSMVYFNSGDKEEDYPDEDSWNGRELVELSTAIKVPDINLFLTSLRIFQYYLSKPGVIMHYNYTELILNDILRFFGGIYYVPDLEKEKQTELFNKIQSEPNKFILKPFHGNKNYITGDKLKSIVPAGDGEPSEELKNGVIFDVCTPPEHETLVIKDDKSNIENVISEYSIYGIILTNENNFVTNKSVSYLVVSKNKDNINDFESFLGDDNEKVVLDLPCLVETKIEPNLTHKIEVKAEEIQKYLDDLKAAEEEAKRKAEEEAKKKLKKKKLRKKKRKKKQRQMLKKNNLKQTHNLNFIYCLLS